jgi:Cytochrome P460
MNRKLATAAVAALALLPAVGHAGTELVAFPTGFAGEFVPYNRVDRPDRKTVRFMYANPAAVEAARPGEPIPHGTVLVMADHKARLDGERRVTDAEGRLVPTDEVVNVFVMEKQPGWGAGYPAKKRNGEWEYAWFLPDATRTPDAKFDGCFACHLNRAGRDYTFTFAKFVLDEKPRP